MNNRLDDKDYIKYCDKYRLRFQYIEEIERSIILSPYAGYIPPYDRKFIDAVRNIIDNGYEIIIINLLESPTTRLVIQLGFIAAMLNEYDRQIEIAVITENDKRKLAYQDICGPNWESKIKWFKSISSAGNFFLNRI